MNTTLFDDTFLKQLNEQRNHIIYARVISLNFKEEPLEQIEGHVTGGNISIDGNSAIRRSCSLTLAAQDLNIHDQYWSLNTKIKIEIGLQNDINSNYDNIIWFPQGIYLITNFNITQATNNYTININGKDKMSLLNGEIGGYIGLQTSFSPTETEVTDSTTGEITEVVKEQEPIKRIIQDLVHTYGREPFSNIIINNLDIYGLEQLEFDSWDDETSVVALNSDNQQLAYLLYNEDTKVFEKVVSSLTELTEYQTQSEPHKNIAANTTWSFLNFKTLTTLEDSVNNNITLIEKINPNEDDEDFDGGNYSLACIESGEICGYKMTDLVYDEDLIGNATDTVTSILDKIVKKLGEFEYFYNLDGQFIFQEKQTYTQSSWNDLIKTNRDTYINPKEAAKFLSYSFEGGNLVTSFQNTPNINNIKNDYVVWGERSSSTGVKKSIHAHYAIDKKPEYYKTLDGIEYISSSGSSTKLAGLKNYKKIIPPWAEYFNPETHNVMGMTTEEMEAKYKDICENWWDILDWAEYYSLLTGEYPPDAMSAYLTAYDQLDLNSIFSSSSQYKWGESDAWKSRPCAIFDIYPNYAADGKYGALGFVGHNPSSNRGFADPADWTVENIGAACGHQYDYFLKLYNNITEKDVGKAYFYKPKIPTAVLNKYVQQVDWREIIYQMALDWANHKNDDDFFYQVAQNNQSYYPTGITGYEQYYSDMESFWRWIYDPTQAEDETSDFSKYDGWHENVYDDPAVLDFWFDFFDCENNSLEKFAVPVIGPRSKVVSDSTVKMITHEQVPEVIYISAEDYEAAKKKDNLMEGYVYVTDEKVVNHMQFVKSSKSKTAQEMMETLLYNYGQANETITLQTLPIYHLEPNTLIYAHDDKSNINNIFIINKISLSLTYNGTMTINATKMPETLT